MDKPNRILILFAHPALEKSRINRQLIKAVRGMDSITIRDLYEHYPNFHIDVKFEQALLVTHDIIIFQHPFYWYSSPAILKEWQDLVLEHGFAYGHNGTALRGKKLLSAITTGGSEQAYCRQGHNYFTIRELLAPFEQTAHLCGMEYLPPFVIHGTHQLQETHQISRYVKDYQTVILMLRNHAIDWEHLLQHRHLNHYLEQALDTQETPLHVQ
ncbi:MAG: Glutathione-regulated potassium-efflux system ancillary protein KefG [Chroococcidiopsis cubana SAG 39.79]|uniref:NAD(P)H oxidoreductase n=1 Tax=Chroococcidiopsis cubana SAG 39.79 TaxID=388085 RepID=A0AB37UAQ0_9CYAN|nr:NAD(P)H-dependent oxidoreductase [Chroococcidiopsis cubana]MDZ4879120.1 Glutathione-regulated potassium-efflux system ancillary protein KefG [Chroococcidiopsis cubana SAG 39.79]PSB66183.1 NAD(P)H oxidoreductase [Chroococcidiopsis cubana CCALA 043]RUT03330.1 NAD(P)H oxidoreductase [Chroococcidiopsis cubana SAG 39.79]